MRELLYAFFAGLLISLISEVPAQAGPISGSLVVNGAIPSPYGDLATTTVFSNVVLTTGGATGDYTSVTPGTNVGTVSLDTTNLAAFTFGDSSFGTFTATSGSELVSPALTRTFYITGNFTPGSLFSSTLTTNTASILISLNQTGGANTVIGWTSTFNTPAVAPPGVPEPASMSLTGIGLSLIGLFMGYRKRCGK
jgi:hypothetical protein